MSINDALIEIKSCLKDAVSLDNSYCDCVSVDALTVLLAYVGECYDKGYRQAIKDIHLLINGG